jgi:CBS domain-containing protein
VLADRLSTLPLTPPVTVETGTSMGQLIEEVQRRRVGCVLVSEAGRPVGIFTERDVLMKVVARDVKLSEPVDQFMTRDPEMLTPDHTIGDAVHLMTEKQFRHVPVVGNDGVARGIVSIRDIITLVAELFPEQVLNLPPRPHQKMETPEGG